MWYQLLPHLKTGDPSGPLRAKVTIFDLRDVSGQKLVIGDNWGDDWLKVPDEPQERQAL